MCQSPMLRFGTSSVPWNRPSQNGGQCVRLLGAACARPIGASSWASLVATSETQAKQIKVWQSELPKLPVGTESQ